MLDIDNFIKNRKLAKYTPVPIGCERVNINSFLKKYIKWASIPEDLFIELQKRSISGFTFADIPSYRIEEVKNNYEQSKEKDKKWKKCVSLNNRGRAQEKAGRIKSAIKTYELNILDGVPALHSYTRLMVIYRKLKKYDEEIRVIEDAINVFSFCENSASYSSEVMKFKERLNKAIALKEKSENK